MILARLLAAAGRRILSRPSLDARLAPHLPSALDLRVAVVPGRSR